MEKRKARKESYLTLIVSGELILFVWNATFSDDEGSIADTFFE